MQQLAGKVVELSEGRAVLELEDGTSRDVAAPDMIHIEVGMAVKFVDTGDDSPIIAWGV